MAGPVLGSPDVAMPLSPRLAPLLYRERGGSEFLFKKCPGTRTRKERKLGKICSEALFVLFIQSWVLLLIPLEEKALMDTS